MATSFMWDAEGQFRTVSCSKQLHRPGAKEGNHFMKVHPNTYSQDSHVVFLADNH